MELFDSSRFFHLSAKFGKKLDLPSISAEEIQQEVSHKALNDITLLGGVSTTNDQYSRTYVMWHWKANGEHLALIMMVQ